MEEEDKYDRIRITVTTPSEGIKDLVRDNLSLEPYPCPSCGEIIVCGLINFIDHFDYCKKNKCKL